VRKGALDNKLDISSNKVDAVQTTPAGTRVNVTITVKTDEPLCNWLADLQKPENFYAVSSFRFASIPTTRKRCYAPFKWAVTLREVPDMIRQYLL